MHTERFVRSVKEECTGRMIFFGNHRSSVRTQYMAHYTERGATKDWAIGCCSVVLLWPSAEMVE